MAVHPSTRPFCMKDLAKRVHVGIRRAELQDVESLSQLTSELCVSWWDMFASPEIFSYLAEDNEPFGAVSVSAASDSRLDNAGEVLVWYLHPKFRQVGLGRKLLVHGLSVLKRRDFEIARIWIPETADDALKVLYGLHFIKEEIKPLGDMNLLLFNRNLYDFF